MIFLRNKQQSDTAFTLIELLVVIAIIGILSSVVLASLSGARESARDTQRKQDLRQIEVALNMYYNDNGDFPSGVNGRICADCGNGISNALADYMQAVPTDPINDTVSSDGYYYYYDNYHNCNPMDNDLSERPAAVYTFLESEEGNIDDICPDGTGGQAYGDRSDTHKIMLVR